LAQTGARPKIFLATLGTLADFTTRASFAKGIFEAGGIETVAHDGNLASLASGFKDSGTALTCLCASDKTYESDGAMAAAALRAAGARQIYLAGRPGKNEAAYRQAGVQAFIYAGCDVLAVFQEAYGFLGNRLAAG
jgi:methylmalonyl-CoA mutase